MCSVFILHETDTLETQYSVTDCFEDFSCTYVANNVVGPSTFGTVFYIGVPCRCEGSSNWGRCMAPVCAQPPTESQQQHNLSDNQSKLAAVVTSNSLMITK